MPRTILLADDSLTIRKVVELAFSDTDIRVEAVADGREALERLQVMRPDMILADVVMPAPCGYDLCRQVKQSERPVPVLLLAGTFEPFDAERARECGADGHLVKPFESRVLLERVERLLADAIDRAAPAPSVVPAAPPIEETVAVPEAADERGASPEPEPAPEPAGTETALALSAEDLDRLTRAVVERLSDRVLREIAWEVVPELAEVILRERLREVERERSTDGS